MTQAMSAAPVRRLGLIGQGIGYSRSPAMQQAALDALGIPARYELWETPAEGLAARVAALREAGMLGANVTIPHKAAVVPLLDAVAPEARRMAGVVNTIVHEETPEGGVRLIGHNTDVTALARILGERVAWTPGTRRVVVLGAGGAARAALGAARELGAEVALAARRREKAEAALAELGEPMGAGWHAQAFALGDEVALAGALAQADALIQATPVGTGDVDASPISLESLAQLPPHAFVLDVIYAPPETALVRAARARGLRAMGGLAMLLYQGAAAFTLWTRREAPLDTMRAALEL